MTGLEDTFGEDFAQHVREKTAEKRQERNLVTDEQMKDICSMAINEAKFEDGDPQFTYKTENGVTHDVLLVQAPEPERGELWDHLSEPWEGAAKLPLDYLGEWHWSTFPEHVKEAVKDIQSGEWYIVAGNVEENEGDDGDIYYNIYPVRGIVDLEEAKEYAEEGMSEEGFADDDEETSSEPEDFADDPEPEPEQEESGEEPEPEEEDDDKKEEESSSSGGGLGGLIDDDDDDEEEEEDEPVPYDTVAHFIEDLAEKQDEDEEPQIFEITEEHDQLDKLVKITIQNNDLNSSEEAVREVILDVIEEHRDDEEEEEEEEDDLSGNLF